MSVIFEEENGGGEAKARVAARKETADKAAKVAKDVGKATAKVAGKVGRKLKEWGGKAYEKSGELVEQGKLEVKLHQIDGRIAALEKHLGKSLYNLWANGRIEDRILLDLMTEKLKELAAENEERDTTKELIENIKYRPEEGGKKD